MFSRDLLTPHLCKLWAACETLSQAFNELRWRDGLWVVRRLRGGGGGGGDKQGGTSFGSQNLSSLPPPGPILAAITGPRGMSVSVCVCSSAPV